MADFKISQLPVAPGAAEGDFMIINKNNTTTNRIDVKEFVDDFVDGNYLSITTNDVQTVVSSAGTIFSGPTTARAVRASRPGGATSTDTAFTAVTTAGEPFAINYGGGIENRIDGGSFTISTTVDNLKASKFGINGVGNVIIGLGSGSLSAPGANLSNLLITSPLTGGPGVYGTRSQGAVQNDVTENATAFFSRIGTASGTSVKQLTQYNATEGDNEGTIESNYGFVASNMRSGTVENIGFLSSINEAHPGSFSFYAPNTAPNYFKGNTYFGGEGAARTLKLWESTLSDEELLQYEAGTLAVPANVSNPGDGSYARQWYYDRQDAEVQSLLDSGELSYPSYLAAATFNDTFSIADTARTTIYNNGTAAFTLRDNSYVAITVGENNLEQKVKIHRAGVPPVGNPAIEVLGMAGDDSKTAWQLDYRGNFTGYTGAITYNIQTSEFEGITTSPVYNFQFNGDTQATINTIGRFDSKMDKKPTSDGVVGFQTLGDVPLDSGSKFVTCYRADAGLTDGHTTEWFRGFHAMGSEARKGSPGKAAAFVADSFTDMGGTSYGFFASLGQGFSENYAYYSEGSAKSHFVGGLNIGDEKDSPTIELLNSGTAKFVAGEYSGSVRVGGTTNVFLGANGSCSFQSRDRAGVNIIPGASSLEHKLTISRAGVGTSNPCFEILNAPAEGTIKTFQIDYNGALTHYDRVTGDQNWSIDATGSASGITVTRAAVVTDEQNGTVETLLDIITDLRARVAALEAGN